MGKQEITETEIYDRLCQCNEAQLAWIEVQLHLNQAFLAQQAVAARAREILRLVKQNSKGNKWVAPVLHVLDQAQSFAESYLGTRLQHLKSFLVKGPDSEDAAPSTVGTIKDLRARLKDLGKLRRPVLIRVRGTLFPAALLTAGWWERKQHGPAPLSIDWKNPLQRWLFEGFDLWAPSWDICWGAVDPDDPAKRYYIGQLTEGDEADSLPVVIGAEKAQFLHDEFADSWGGFEAVIVGQLGHRFQFGKKLPPNVKREDSDFYVSVDDDNPRHKIQPLTSATPLYSGYVWKVVAPEAWMKEDRTLGLNQVYFIWEHTNFAAKQALAYNLDALEHKQELIAREHAGSPLVMLQKSHAIVPGEPKWSVKKFYDFYLGKKIGKQ